MKKLNFILALFLCAAAMWAADDPKTVSGFGRYDNSGKYTTKTYFFNGFNFGALDSFFTKNGLQESIVYNYADIISKKPGGRYTVIGHSMGGLTALGYAGYLNQSSTPEFNKIEAVITVSGANKGARLLRGGLGSALSRVNEKLSIVVNGGVAIGRVLVPPAMPIDIPFPNKLASAKSYLLNYAMPAITSSVFTAALNMVSADEYAQIRDLTPESSFIKKYVSETVSHSYKRKTGTKTIVEVSPWSLLGIPIIKTRTEDVYTYYTAYEDKTKVGDTLPVAYIMGLKHNMLGMTGKENDIRKSFNAIRGAAIAAEAIHISKCVGLIGLFDGSIAHAINAQKLASFCGNLDGELNSLLGASEGDSFLAKEDMYYPRQFTDPNSGAIRSKAQKYLGNPPNGYFGLNKYNHQEINPHDSKDAPMTKENKEMDDLYKQLDPLVAEAKK
ncbi:MAG: hypothetical protein LBD48_07090 [Treponema sp.]|jgi:hypothetical protein|nr:hypothetical protein [Treponema sp.]